MKKNFKSFYRSHRIGLSAGKTLLWIWVKNDLPKINGEVGIDLAGGRMFNKRFLLLHYFNENLPYLRISTICLQINDLCVPQ